MFLMDERNRVWDICMTQRARDKKLWKKYCDNTPKELNSAEYFASLVLCQMGRVHFSNHVAMEKLASQASQEVASIPVRLQNQGFSNKQFSQ
jgi:hypothetical protein